MTGLATRPWARWVALTTLCFANLVVALDTLIMLVAVPSIQSDLGLATKDAQWIITAYALTFGGLLLLGGRSGDHNGRKLAFMVGIVGFTGASVLGGVAQNSAMLFAGRALQGVFAALLVPAALATITVTFTEPKERARAFAIYASVAASGAAIGLILGGFLAEYLSWRWCLLINVPVGALVVLFTAIFVKESKLSGRPNYDLPGAATVTIGLTGLVYAFVRAPEHGWTDPVTLACFGGSAALIAAFVIIEKTVTQPLLPLALLDRTRIGAVGTGILTFGGLYGGYLFIILYLQGIEGYSAVECGAALLSYPVALVITAMVLEQPLGRINPRIPILVGSLIGAAVFTWFAFIRTDWDYITHLMPAYAVLGVGMLVVYVAGTSAVMGGSGDDDAGVVSAVLNAAQQVGSALGPAIVTTLSLEVTQ